MTAKVMRIIAAGAVSFLAGCGMGGAAGQPGDGVWGRTFLSAAITVDGQDKQLVSGTRVRLTFTDGEVRADAGCNHLSGRASTDGGRLAVAELGGTLMGCDGDRAAQDSWLSGFLRSGPNWRLDGETLTLRAGGTQMRLTDERTANPDRPLLGTRWVVESTVDGQAAGSVPAGSTAYLRFTEGDRVEGSTGCNTVAGTATARGDRITFRDLTTTQMACADQRGQLDAAVAAVLKDDTTFTIQGDRLTLSRADGKGLRLRAAP